MTNVSTPGERVISLVVLTEDPIGPSVRHRWTLAAPGLAAHGIETKILPVEPAGLRAKSFDRATDADLVVIHRKLFRLPDLHRLMRTCRGRLVYDLDDAVMYRATGRKRQWSFFRTMRFLRTLRRSHLFLAGNDYLVSRSPRRCRVFLRPTPVELGNYTVRDDWPQQGTIVGWIGTESTRQYIDGIQNALAELCAAREDLVFHLIGPEPGDWPGVKVKHIPWSEEGEAAALRNLDV